MRRRLVARLVALFAATVLGTACGGTARVGYDGGNSSLEDAAQESGGFDANAEASVIDAGTGSVGVLGQSCSPPGMLACAGNEQKLQLLCNASGEWVATAHAVARSSVTACPVRTLARARTRCRNAWGTTPDTRSASRVAARPWKRAAPTWSASPRCSALRRARMAVASRANPATGNAAVTSRSNARAAARPTRGRTSGRRARAHAWTSTVRPELGHAADDDAATASVPWVPPSSCARMPRGRDGSAWRDLLSWKVAHFRPRR
jgi:hypothetical protein